MAPNFTVFTADISNTGWYGFPYHEKNGVVKVARHSNGLELHPRLDDRVVHHKEIEHLRAFLKESLPELSSAPLVFTRRCLYTDTLDGHYWIDNHPEIKGLSVGTGGNGHGLKMAPMLGEMQADVAESGTNQFSDRYRWRHLESQSAQKEDARFVE
jgi:glycine/D-amino acid oxidase-like deaminating enzyme